eukprot:5171702-Amphidinium_carterae.1
MPQRAPSPWRRTSAMPIVHRSILHFRWAWGEDQDLRRTGHFKTAIGGCAGRACRPELRVG